MLFNFYYSIVYFSIVYYSIAMQPLAQEFPLGLIQLYLILYYIIIHHQIHYSYAHNVMRCKARVQSPPPWPSGSMQTDRGWQTSRLRRGRPTC